MERTAGGRKGTRARGAWTPNKEKEKDPHLRRFPHPHKGRDTGKAATAGPSHRVEEGRLGLCAVCVGPTPQATTALATTGREER